MGAVLPWGEGEGQGEGKWEGAGCVIVLGGWVLIIDNHDLLVCRIKVCEGWDHILINDEVIMKNIMMECMPSSVIYKYLLQSLLKFLVLFYLLIICDIILILYNICYIHR